MSTGERPEIGVVGWIDLTVDDASALRDFYTAVAGWEPRAIDMGGYQDFQMASPTSGRAVAGICHARGGNVEMPPVWLIYITVASVDDSIEHCREAGGEVLVAPRDMGTMGRYCVIRDPAGAAVALFQYL